MLQMTKSLTSKFFAANRKRLRLEFPELDLIIIRANGLQQKTTTENYPFRQDSYFYYLTGINEPNIYLVMDKKREYLLVPELSHGKIMFDGDIDRGQITTVSGITELVSVKAGWRDLTERLKQVKKVGIIKPAPTYIDHYGMYSASSRRHLISQLKNRNSKVELINITESLASARRVKQPEELAILQNAITITLDTLKVVEKRFLAGDYKNEFDVELDLIKHYRALGAQKHGFDPIVAGGAKATQLHAMDNSADLQKGAALLVDTGADFDHYCADITRAWHPNPTKRYREVYDAVQTVQTYAMSLLKPGVIPMKYEQQVETFMGEQLLKLKLINDNNRENVRRYFPSLTSHFLGLDVHDAGSFEEPLQPGVVLTVEPGIYIPEEGIGVRIEDDVLITQTGIKNLSA